MTTLRVRPVKNNSQTWEYEIRRNDRTLKYQVDLKLKRMHKTQVFWNM